MCTSIIHVIKASIYVMYYTCNQIGIILIVMILQICCTAVNKVWITYNW